MASCHGLFVSGAPCRKGKTVGPAAEDAADTTKKQNENGAAAAESGVDDAFADIIARKNSAASVTAGMRRNPAAL